jgi:hypothetical protein
MSYPYALNLSMSLILARRLWPHLFITMLEKKIPSDVFPLVLFYSLTKPTECTMHDSGTQLILLKTE